MNILAWFFAGVGSGLLANYISPPFKRATDAILGHGFHLLNPARFDLTGTWLQTFTEPTADIKSWEEIQESVALRHLAGSVVGKGVTHDDGRLFSYELRVHHNLVFGSYTKSGAKGNLTGNGVIQMIVSPDRLSMKGQATWFDHDTEKIESSECRWVKCSSSVEPVLERPRSTPGKPVPAPQR